eukprot:jgi/Ulvmu1/7310/UM035_0099.1
MRNSRCIRYRTCWMAHRCSARPATNRRHLCRATRDDLVAWVRRNGGKVAEGVDITSTATAGLGLKTTKPCTPGEALIWLPRSCQLTYGPDTSPALSAMIEKIPPSFWGLRLAMKVLEERSKIDSHFLPYIQNLPAVVNGLPMFFSPDTIKELWYPPLVSEVSKRGRFMYQFHRDVLAPQHGSTDDPFGGVAVDLSGVGWALGVVTSRAFATNGPDKPRSLLPLIDIANHSFTHNNCDIDKRQGGTMVLVSKKAIPAGSDLLLSYGALDNHTLLLDYGFMDPTNPFDNMKLAFDVKHLLDLLELATGNKPSLAGWQKQLLLQARLIGDNANKAITVGRGSAASGELPMGIDPRLIVAARVVCASSAAQASAKSATANTSTAAALVLIHQYLQMLFSGLGLDATQDQSRTLQSGLPADLKTAAQLRLYKALMCEEVLSKVQISATDACKDMGVGGDIANLTLKDLLDVA